MEVKFQIKDIDDTILVYTTRPDTIFGATYLVISCEHPLLKKYEDRIKRVIANAVGREVRATVSRYSVAVSRDTLSCGRTFLLVDASVLAGVLVEGLATSELLEPVGAEKLFCSV